MILFLKDGATVFQRDLNSDNIGKEEYFAQNRHDKLSKSFERFSIEKDPTKDIKSKNQDQRDRRRKREEYEITKRELKLILLLNNTL